MMNSTQKLKTASYWMKKMNKYGFIVEGTNDAHKIESLFPNARCVVTNGTRFTNRTKMDIEDLIHSCHETFIMTDPDTPGDLLAEKIQNYYAYFELRRILLNPAYCTEDKLSFKGKPYKKTGVENASPAYLEMVIHYYINHPKFTGYFPFKEPVENDS